jgi:ureidoacrylate peracid hydrolase
MAEKESLVGTDPGKILEKYSLYELAGWREYFKKAPAVLLVVDPQNDVLDEKGTLSFWNVWKHAREIGAVGNMKRVIRSCRAKGIPVIWAKQYRLAGGKDVFPGTFDGDLLSLIRTIIPNAFMQDTWETEIYGELLEVMEEKDIVLGKHGSSMFEGTNLDKLLKSLGVKALIVTGVLTDFCVEATVRSACDRGYLAVTVSDACATENQELHEKALRRLERMIGPVTDTEGLLDLLEKYEVPPRPKQPRYFDLQKVGESLGKGLSLNDIVKWANYLKPEKTAFLVIDAQNDNLHERGSLNFLGAWKAAKESGAVENVKKLVEACRAKGVPVFWIKQNRLPGGRDIFPGTLDADMMNLIHAVLPGAFLGDTWDTDIYEELKPLVREDELVIEKPGWSAFEGTALERYLNSLGIDTLIVSGFLTDFCVESTVRQASDRGFFTIVVSDACATTDREAHELALARFDRLIGPVISTETLLETLAGTNSTPKGRALRREPST